MKITLTKMEAARNELREAIRLWFADGDLASMHLLACSAHQVIADINAARGGRDLIYDSLIIKEEGRTEWINNLKNEYNHLKHADRSPDPDHPVVLDSEFTEFFILFTCLGLEIMKLPFTPAERVFVIYFMVSHPNLVKEGRDPFSGVTKESIAAARIVPKSIFFTAIIQNFEEQN